MQHPFQCIVTVRPPRTDQSYLLAACGPKLWSVSLESSDLVSEWSAVDDEKAVSAAPVDANDSEERPLKKQKTISAKIPAAKDIIKLTVSPNHEYVLAVTEDKNLRVFSFSHAGHLSELSSRCMPKRPCAIQVLPDNVTILCGDKFGDVYSLPLLPDPDWQPPKEDVDDARNEDPLTHFKPSATNKTVHTQRNLKTLEAQQNQKLEPARPKDSLGFEHQLLLGHVSMLTDLTYTVLAGNGKRKAFIITADRDEHIRFSRGPPQSHIIEGYCLGHTEFVSKLCVIPHSRLLLSGGGDSWIGLWDWPESILRRKIPLNQVFGEPCAISLIESFTSAQNNFVMVGCERSPILGLIDLQDLDVREGSSMKDSLFPSEEDIIPWSVVHLDLPVVGVAFTDSLVLLSFDAQKGEQRRVGAYKLTRASPTGWKLDSVLAVDKKLQKLNTTAIETAQERDLDNLLYGIDRLRKRGYHDETLEDE